MASMKYRILRIIDTQRIYAISFRRFDMHFAIERIEVNFADNRSEHLSCRSINVSYWIHVTGWWIVHSLKLPWQVHALDSTPGYSYFNTRITFQFFKLCILMWLIVFAFLIFRFKFFGLILRFTLHTIQLKLQSCLCKNIQHLREIKGTHSIWIISMKILKFMNSSFIEKWFMHWFWIFAF